MIKNIKNLLN